MIRRNWIVWLTFAFFFILFGVVYFMYSTGPTQNWTTHYKHNSDSPYGNELLFNLVKNLYEDKEFKLIEQPLSFSKEFKNSSRNNIYFFSGEYFYPNQSTTGILADFIRAGNQAFIAANNVSPLFLDSLLHPDRKVDEESPIAPYSIENCFSILPNFYHPDLSFKKVTPVSHKVMKAKIPMEAAYISGNFIQSLELEKTQSDYYKIGYFTINNDGKFTNYIKIKVGKGWIHLYSTPLVLTNFYLRNEQVFDYAKNLFVHLEKGNIYWHENNQLNNDDVQEHQNVEKSRFGVLLSIKSFRYAWYTFLAAIILFCIFSIRRQQRPIKVIEKTSNSSLEFVETISKFYLLESGHKNMALQKDTHFFSYIKNRYGLNLKDGESATKIKLAKLIKVDQTEIEWLMNNYKKINSLPYITPDELHETSLKINALYVKLGQRKENST